MTLMNLFPVPIYKGSLKPSEEQDKNTNHLLTSLFNNCQRNNWNGESGLSTGQDGLLDIHKHEEIKWLVDGLYEFLLDYWFNGLKYAQPNFFSLQHGWANLHTINDTTVEHSHSDGYFGNSHVSAAYYFRKPKNCGHIHFCDPLDYIRRLTPQSKLVGLDLISTEVAAEQYDFILFPSWLRHKVPPHPVEEERIVFSFNYVGKYD
jgi:uncharacterized protein (TIGR02466 family)